MTSVNPDNCTYAACKYENLVSRICGKHFYECGTEIPTAAGDSCSDHDEDMNVFEAEFNFEDEVVSARKRRCPVTVGGSNVYMSSKLWVAIINPTGTLASFVQPSIVV